MPSQKKTSNYTLPTKPELEDAYQALWATLQNKLGPYFSDYGQLIEKDSPLNNQYQQLKSNISQHIPSNADFRSPQAMSEWAQAAALNAPMGLTLKGAPPTKFSRAHDIAQKNAALPIEQGGLGLPPNNTAMDRAKAMGFDTKAYHGGRNEIEAFDPGRQDGANGYTSSAKGSWFDSKPEVASEYAEKAADMGLPDKVQKEFDNLTRQVERAYDRGNYDLAERLEQHMIDIGNYGQGANITPVLLNTSRFKNADGSIINHGDIQMDLINRAKAGKRSGIVFNNITDSPTMKHESNQYLAFNPKNIRSRFAAFDPMNKDSANILASLLGATTLAGMYGKEQDQPKTLRSVMERKLKK
jgi:hypothetical protein